MNGLTLEHYKRALEYLRIGNASVHRAQAENRKKGIPNWYSINGVIISDQEIEATAKKRK
ncbi:MAG: hypothetical protein ACD_42C00254G0003 [uncultured bacterium]|nr:MAG: hypothetical protein ACD_42C00254G0003 [uncultured bacterium]OGT33104.1 MAG: hypothetical protein A3C44_05860 [Gammaproteobacteria bacterium RIFCSPHIGHO2_02_FULL_39_13]OGT49315.1 MAG: hypothetical protein A3E53_07680 [Gammaproteobacteria bacterium RIFCSPHIGHO2_12_FULL_39_24]